MNLYRNKVYKRDIIMKYKELAKTGEELSVVGLGCMGMSHAYGQPNDTESIATLEYALDLGINFWDTADVYGSGANEELISKVLVPNRDRIFLATQFGFRVKGSTEGAFTDRDPTPMLSKVEMAMPARSTKERTDNFLRKWVRIMFSPERVRMPFCF